MLWFYAILGVMLTSGCSSTGRPAKLSIEAKMRRAESALARQRVFEAKRWVSEVLQQAPQEPRAQALMARVIERELIRDKSLTPLPLLEEPDPHQKDMHVQTWLERSRGFLEINQFQEALGAAEQVFLVDPEHHEASRLVDEIKQKARKMGRDEELFLQELYDEEISRRIKNYLREAETAVQEQRERSARFLIEKVLILDPKNARGKRLLALLDQKEKAA